MPRDCTCTGDAFCPRCQALLERSVGYQAPLRTAPTPPRRTQTAPVLGGRYKSATEQRFATEMLERWQKQGDIVGWYYEPLKGLRLDDTTSYTPDFLTVDSERQVVIYEVKGGFIRPQDWLKFKMASSTFYWWPFVLAQYKEGRWQYKNARSHAVQWNGLAL
jgi:hypothetical protein